MTSPNPVPSTPDDIRRYVKANYALGLPEGSIRAMLALVVFGGIWGYLWRWPDHEAPSYLRDLMFIILGHYFAVRRPASPAVGPPPLYLPRGTVRILLVLGFGAVTALLIRQDRMLARTDQGTTLSHAGITLILVAGFLLGVMVSRLGHGKPSRRVEDARAIVSLLAGVILLLMVFHVIQLPDLGKPQGVLRWIQHLKFENILAAVVGFYFGSRS